MFASYDHTSIYAKIERPYLSKFLGSQKVPSYVLKHPPPKRQHLTLKDAPLTCFCCSLLGIRTPVKFKIFFICSVYLS